MLKQVSWGTKCFEEIEVISSHFFHIHIFVLIKRNTTTAKGERFFYWPVLLGVHTLRKNKENILLWCKIRVICSGVGTSALSYTALFKARVFFTLQLEAGLPRLPSSCLQGARGVMGREVKVGLLPAHQGK